LLLVPSPGFRLKTFAAVFAEDEALTLTVIVTIEGIWEQKRGNDPQGSEPITNFHNEN
jgi:hypothetical protein